VGTAEPPEHWAPPESLDPTPVWKQYALVGLLLIAFLAAITAYVAAAAAPDLATPPALVAGNRVVLAVGDHPPGTTVLVELAGRERAFYLTRLGDEAFAVRRSWSMDPLGERACAVEISTPQQRAGEREVFRDGCTGSAFDAEGRVLFGAAPRDLDRYLVSRKGDRFVVNLDRPITGAPR
jgi:Rieske Fe-S protein